MVIVRKGFYELIPFYQLLSFIKMQQWLIFAFQRVKSAAIAPAPTATFIFLSLHKKNCVIRLMRHRRTQFRHPSRVAQWRISMFAKRTFSVSSLCESTNLSIFAFICRGKYLSLRKEPTEAQQQWLHRLCSKCTRRMILMN